MTSQAEIHCNLNFYSDSQIHMRKNAVTACPNNCRSAGILTNTQICLVAKENKIALQHIFIVNKETVSQRHAVNVRCGIWKRVRKNKNLVKEA